MTHCNRCASSCEIDNLWQAKDPVEQSHIPIATGNLDHCLRPPKYGWKYF